MVAGGADAVMTTLGTAKRILKALDGRGLILSVDLMAPDPMAVVENAVALGADSLKTLAFWGADDPAGMRNLGRYGVLCEKWGLPFQAEVIPFSFGATDKHTPENIATAARVGAESGADYVKVQYTGDAESFRQVCEGAGVPVIILGGAKSERPITAQVADAIRAGGAGIAFGAEHLVDLRSRGRDALVRRGDPRRGTTRHTRAAGGAGMTMAPAKAKTFTRAVITGPKAIRMETVPVPEISNTQVLVKIRASALCTWEQRTFAGIDTFSYPLVGGHETSGVVVAVGKDVELKVKEGDQVALAGLKRCGQCYSCRRGIDNICDNSRSKRVPDVPFGPGGFGEYVAAEGYQVFKVGPVATPQEAALTEPTACVIHDLKRHPVTNGDVVVIVGAGIMGLLHLVLAKRTPSFIIVSEPEAARREKATELGADALIDPSTRGLRQARRGALERERREHHLHHHRPPAGHRGRGGGSGEARNGVLLRLGASEGHDDHGRSELVPPQGSAALGLDRTGAGRLPERGRHHRTARDRSPSAHQHGVPALEARGGLRGGEPQGHLPSARAAGRGAQRVPLVLARTS